MRVRTSKKSSDRTGDWRWCCIRTKTLRPAQKTRSSVSLHVFRCDFSEDWASGVSKAHQVLSNPRSKAQYDAVKSAYSYGASFPFFQAGPMEEEDDFEYDEPNGNAKQDTKKGGQSRKARRKKQYAERQRSRKEEADKKQFERVWKGTSSRMHARSNG
jgi:DnaJ-class molecular chaperone